MFVCMYSVYKLDYRGAAAPKNQDGNYSKAEEGLSFKVKERE